MKIKFHFILIMALSVLFVSCGKDNFTAPKSVLSGQITYKGEPVGVEFGQVRMQLWQPGFGKLAPIDAQVAQDGSYSAMLFDGNYKAVFAQNRGPFRTIAKDAIAKDTLFINLNGSQTLNVEVLPYYMIRNPKFNGGEGKVSVSLALEKVITDVNAKDIERISLFVNKTELVSRANNVSVADMAGADVKNLANVSLVTTVPALSPKQNYVYARVGVKIKNVEDMVFSPVQKIQY